MIALLVCNQARQNVDLNGLELHSEVFGIVKNYAA